jgi:hypothetical protein
MRLQTERFLAYRIADRCGDYSNHRGDCDPKFAPGEDASQRNVGGRFAADHQHCGGCLLHHDKGKEKVRRQLAGFKAYPNIAEWPIEIHLFVREDREADLRKRIEPRKLQFKVFTLEHAFRRWKWDAQY